MHLLRTSNTLENCTLLSQEWDKAGGCTGSALGVLQAAELVRWVIECSSVLNNHLCALSIRSTQTVELTLG